MLGSWLWAGFVLLWFGMVVSMGFNIEGHIVFLILVGLFWVSFLVYLILYVKPEKKKKVNEMVVGK
jgi:hypothetical protein